MPDRAEHRVAGGCAFRGLVQGAMVEPDEGVPAVTAVANRQRGAVAVAHYERTGGVKTDADYVGGPRPGDGHRFADC